MAPASSAQSEDEASWEWPATTLFLVAMAATLALTLFRRRRDVSRLPGPCGLPFFGALPFWKGGETNLAWFRRYGPMYRLRSGPYVTVYLDKVALVKRYLEDRGEEFADRPPGPAAIANGILYGSGAAWRHNRRLLFELVWGGDDIESRLESTVTPMIDDLLDTLAAKSKASVNGAKKDTDELACFRRPSVVLSEILQPFAVNLMTTFVRGKGHRADDPEFIELRHLIDAVESIDLTSIATLVALRVPCLRPLVAPGDPDLYDLSSKIQAIVRGWVSQHQEVRRQGQGQDPERVLSRDLIDEFLDSPDYDDIACDDKEHVQSLMDMYFGGVDTLVSYLEFLFLFLLHNPFMARRVQEEVEGVTGGERTPRWEDRHAMTFTRCLLLETHRLGSVTPSCLPHVAIEDCQVEGFNVPKGTHMKTSQHVLHRDTEHFPDPELFRPERHLDAQGKVKVPESFRPFGIGPRLCPGKLLADVVLFLVLVKVLQKFDVTPDGPTLPPFATKVRLVRRLLPYSAIFSPRQ